MAAQVTKLEELRENLKIARYCVQNAEMQSDCAWIADRISEQETIANAALAKIDEIKADAVKAQASLPAKREHLKACEAALTEYVNRGQLNKADEIATKLAALVAKLRDLGYTDEQIQEFVNA